MSPCLGGEFKFVDVGVWSETGVGMSRHPCYNDVRLLARHVSAGSILHSNPCKWVGEVTGHHQVPQVSLQQGRQSILQKLLPSNNHQSSRPD